MGGEGGCLSVPQRLVTPVFLRVILATFAYFVAIGALIPALPRYVEGPLRGDDVAVGWVIGIFSLAAVLLRPATGRIGDRRGRRLLVVAGGVFIAASVAAYVLADSLEFLLVLRVISGAGEAFFFVGAASVVNDLAPEERRGEAVSLFSLGLYAGLAVGPVLGETVLEVAGFDATWLVAAASAVLALVIGGGLPDTRPPDVATVAHAGLIHRAGLLPGTVLAASVWGLAGFSAFVPLYALDIGLSGSRLVFLMYSAIVLSIRFFGARIPDRFGARLTARSALAASALGLGVISFWTSPLGLFAGTSVFAVGQALAFPALMTIAVRGAPASERGAVVGTFTAFFDLAFGIGAVTLGTVAEAFGYEGSFAVAAVVALAGLGLLFAYAQRSAAAVAHAQPAVNPSRNQEKG